MTVVKIGGDSATAVAKIGGGGAAGVHDADRRANSI